MMRRFRTYPQIGGKRGGIPSGWVELEWVQSTGSQYAVISRYTPSINNIQEFGLRQTDTTVPFGCTNFTIVSKYHRFFKTSGFGVGQYNDGKFNIWRINATSPSVSINGKAISAGGIGNVPASGPFWLFGRSDTGALGNASFSYFKEMTQDGVDVIHLVGVRNANTNEVAMCDILTGEIYHNAGTGAFVAGPDKAGLKATPPR